MTQTKFTPGPWRVAEFDDLREPAIVGRPMWPCQRHGVEGEWQVASVDDLCGDDRRDEAIANARLIAAAPEMYEALKYARLIATTREAAAIFDAALSKAEG